MTRSKGALFLSFLKCYSFFSSCVIVCFYHSIIFFSFYLTSRYSLFFLLSHFLMSFFVLPFLFDYCPSHFSLFFLLSPSFYVIHCFYYTIIFPSVFPYISLCFSFFHFLCYFSFTVLSSLSLFYYFPPKNDALQARSALGDLKRTGPEDRSWAACLYTVAVRLI